MSSTVHERLENVPLRNAKAGLKRGEASLQKLKPEAGEVLELARANARIEPKQMADEMGISHSLVLRGLKGIEHLSFHRLWDLSDEFWAELLIAIAKKRHVANVRVSIDLPETRRIA